MQRFFVEPYQVQEEEHRITLTGPDVNHMKNVLRMRIGEDVWISDGGQKEYHCTIEAFEEEGAVLHILYAQEPQYELPSRIYLFQGLPKGDKMELIIQKIFERAKAHPEIIPDLNRLMDYYLPMTVKLLDAYEDMDSQPVQGENIASSKREIEETIDTLNVAFEKLLDSVFEDTAMDVSSDISVLHTVLAQEGLTENEFDKIRKEAAAREKTY